MGESSKLFCGRWDEARRNWTNQVDLKTLLLEDISGPISEFEPEIAEFERIVHGMVKYEPGE